MDPLPLNQEPAAEESPSEPGWVKKQLFSEIITEKSAQRGCSCPPDRVPAQL